MTKPLGSSKRYQDVKQTLRARIEAGTYKRGERLPSGADLAREFAVSGITIRRAISDLQTEGLVRGRQGLGVFVSDHPRIHRRLNPPFIKSLGGEMRRSGVRPSLEVLSFDLVTPPANVLLELALGADDFVFKHERLILADGNPVGLDTTYLPKAVGKVIGPGMDHEFLMPLLEQHGIAYRDITYKLEATALSGADAEKFAIEPGLPMLSMTFKPVSMRGKPIFLGHLLTRAEWFSFEFCVSHAQRPEPTRGGRSRTLQGASA